MDLHFFNPSCEIEISNGSKFFCPPKMPLLLENDLAVLPMIFAKKDDCILVKKMPDNDFVNRFKDIFCCNFVDFDDAINGSLKEENFDNFLPWGISPRAFEIAKKINPKFENLQFLDSQKEIFNRKFSKEILDNLLMESSLKDFFVEESPIMISCEKDAYQFLDNNNGGVFKIPISSSGRGVRFFHHSQKSDNLSQWLNFSFDSYGFVMAEKLYTNLLDFSLHFFVDKDKISFEGISTFSTSNTGFYMSSDVENFSDDKYYNKVFEEKFGDFDFKTLTSELIKIFSQKGINKIFSGYLGIDCMIVDSLDGKKIHPIVEINPRKNMGIVSLKLKKLTNKNTFAKYHVIQSRDFANFKDKNYLKLVPENSKNFMAILEFF